MSSNCINHQFINAHWQCKKCGKAYCFDCVEKKHFKFSKDEAFVHICPECKRTTDWIGIKHIFDSPTKSAIAALRYPFAVHSLIVLLAIAIISMFFSKVLIINELLFLLIWCILLSYSTNITESILKGETKPPAFTSIPIPRFLQHIFLIFKQAFVYLVVSTLFLFSKNFFESNLAYYAIPVIILPMPFIMIKIITSNTVKKLLDISSFTSVIKQRPILYLAACISYIPVVIMFDLMLNYNPIIITLLLSFIMLFIYKLLGQIILECSSQLNYSIDYENFKDMYTLESLHGFKT